MTIMTNINSITSGPAKELQPVRREFTGRDGGKLVADTYGDPSDPAVLFAHGGGQTRHAWGESARIVAENGWYTLAIDLRGHGESAWSADGDYLIETLAKEMRGIFREIRRPLIAVGASMGGMISLSAVGFAAEQLLDGLVLVDIVPNPEVEGVGRIVSFMRGRPEGFASLEDAAAYVAAYRNRTPPRNVEGLRKNLRLNEMGRWVWHWDPRVMDDRNHTHRCDPDYYERAARNLRIPTLLVRGSKSDVVSGEGVRDFMKLVPHARYVDLKDAGHMVAGDVNDAFTYSILEFLNEVMPPGGSASTATRCTEAVV